jgi:hypothetical protein
MFQQLVIQLGRPAALVFDPVDTFARDFGALGLAPRPQGDLAYSAVARVVGGASQALAPPLRLVTLRNADGYDLFIGLVERPGAPGRRLPLDAGEYQVRVSSPLYQPLDLDVIVPMPDPRTPTLVELGPGYAYPFPAGRRPGTQTDVGQAGLTLLRGGLGATDGSGIAGAVVSASAFGQAVTYRTDDSGQWVLVFPDPPLPQPPQPGDPRPPVTPFPVTVVFDWTGADGAAVHVEVPGFLVMPAATTGFPQQSLRGDVRKKSGGPLAGAAVTVDGFGGAVTSGADGSWLYYFRPGQPPAAAGPVTVRAVAGGQELTQTVAVVPGRRTPVPTFMF